MGTIAAPIQLTDAELKLLQTLVYQECGMHFDERRTHFLQDRLLRRLKECRVDSFYSYYRLLISQEGKAGVVVGVTDDLTARFSAVDLVRKGAEALGGKGGGGRSDMAQAGGPDGSKAHAALEAIASALGAG